MGIKWTCAVLASLATLASSSDVLSSEAQTPVTATVGTEVGLTVQASGQVVAAGGTVPAYVERVHSGDSVVITVVPK